MTTIIYDATFEGLLTVVFEIYERKLLQVKLHKEEFRNGALFEEVLTIGTDEIKAKRVLKGLKERLSSEGIKRLYITHMAEMPDSDIILLGYIRHVFDSERNIEEDYGNKYVLRLSELTKMIGRERHRMEAFIRFQKLSDETFYAAIEPDFN
ncbi:MAG TPA: TIGR03915 family putative DNA repair protein, partial [Mucilaginibacter sp.]|nr:TIGR03915 family putative DNA repair protein [Mucilaginibacter sp.]